MMLSMAVILISFLSTLSLRRATTQGVFNLFANPDFYPRSPCGERLKLLAKWFCDTLFLSTLSLRRATRVLDGSKSSIEISIHALLAESDSGRPETRRSCAISIHALLAESDRRTNNNCIDYCISIHALLAESDNLLRFKRVKFQLFLSTLSLRRATCNLTQKRHPPHNFYPRSPCGERLVVLHIVGGAGKFLSTLSLRRATS